MKTVFPNNQVAHEWAKYANDTNSTRTGRNSGKSFWFDGPSLYSYRTEIARLITSPSGELVVILNEGSYSNTTSAHQSKAWGAVRHLPCFYIPQCDRGDSLNPEPEIIVSHYVARIARLRECAAKARNEDTAERWLDGAEQDIEKMAQFCSMFTLPIPEIPPYNKAAILNAAKDRDAARRKADKEAAARRDAEAAERKERDEREQAERLENAKAALSPWRDGGPWTGHDFYPLPVALRLNPSDASEIETSHGARVSLASARRLYAALVAGEKVAGADLDGYRITSAGAETVKIGCHEIPRAEIERFFASLPAEPETVAA